LLTKIRKIRLTLKILEPPKLGTLSLSLFSMMANARRVWLMQFCRPRQAFKKYNTRKLQ